jgi:DNA-directed RNA polymerase specialized sigma24 family protein
MSWKWNKNAVNSLYAPFCSGVVPGETQSSIQNSSRIAATSEHSINADELQQLYLPDVSRYVRRRIENPDEADDMTAEVFAAAFAALPRFRHECHPRIWLLRIVHRRILMAARHRKTHRYALRDSHHSAHAEAQE